MKPRPISFRRRGFTLIELLAALTIATLIMVAAAQLFVTTLHSWEAGSRRHELLQVARKTSDLIERHLRSALKPGADGQVIFEGDDLSEDEEQTGHRLTLLSGAPARFPRSQPPVDSQEITFELDPLGETAGMSLRVQSPPDDLPREGGYIIPLSAMVTGFAARYYDGIEWSDMWSGKDLPLAVEFTLTLQSQDEPSWRVEQEADAPQTETFTRLVWLPLGKAAAVTGGAALQTGKTVEDKTGGSEKSASPAGVGKVQ